MRAGSVCSGRRSPLLRLQGDERLIALIREGQERAFETLFERYQARLLAFCRGMLASSEDAEDVLQEVFVAAHKAILADNRAINARPWLYRIARNRCLNHLRKPVPEGQDSMDVHPHENGVSVADRVQKREEFRALIADVQRPAGDAADRAAPARDRRARLRGDRRRDGHDRPGGQVAAGPGPDVAGGLQPGPASDLRRGPPRAGRGGRGTAQGVRAGARAPARRASAAASTAPSSGETARRWRRWRRSARLPRSRGLLSGKLGLGGAKLGAGSGAGATAGAGAAGSGAAVGTGGAAIGSSGAAVGGAAAGGGGFSLAGGAAAGGLGGALGTKAAASVASVALLTAGAVEVNDYYRVEADRAPVARADRARDRRSRSPRRGPSRSRWQKARRHRRGAGRPSWPTSEPLTPAPAPAPVTESEPEPEPAPPDDDAGRAVAGGADSGTGFADAARRRDPRNSARGRAAADRSATPEPPSDEPPPWRSAAGDRAGCHRGSRPGARAGPVPSETPADPEGSRAPGCPGPGSCRARTSRRRPRPADPRTPGRCGPQASASRRPRRLHPRTVVGDLQDDAAPPRPGG